MWGLFPRLCHGIDQNVQRPKPYAHVVQIVYPNYCTLLAFFNFISKSDRRPNKVKSILHVLRGSLSFIQFFHSWHNLWIIKINWMKIIVHYNQFRIISWFSIIFWSSSMTANIVSPGWNDISTIEHNLRFWPNHWLKRCEWLETATTSVKKWSLVNSWFMGHESDFMLSPGTFSTP